MHSGLRSRSSSQSTTAQHCPREADRQGRLAGAGPREPGVPLRLVDRLLARPQPRVGPDRDARSQLRQGRRSKARHRVGDRQHRHEQSPHDGHRDAPAPPQGPEHSHRDGSEAWRGDRRRRTPRSRGCGQCGDEGDTDDRGGDARDDVASHWARQHPPACEREDGRHCQHAEYHGACHPAQPGVGREVGPLFPSTDHGHAEEHHAAGEQRPRAPSPKQRGYQCKRGGAEHEGRREHVDVVADRPNQPAAEGHPQPLVLVRVVQRRLQRRETAPPERERDPSDESGNCAPADHGQADATVTAPDQGEESEHGRRWGSRHMAHRCEHDAGTDHCAPPGAPPGRGRQGRRGRKEEQQGRGGVVADHREVVGTRHDGNGDGRRRHSPSEVWCRGTPTHARHDEGDHHVDDASDENKTIGPDDLQPGPHEGHGRPRAEDLEVHLIDEGAVPHSQSAGQLDGVDAVTVVDAELHPRERQHDGDPGEPGQRVQAEPSDGGLRAPGHGDRTSAVPGTGPGRLVAGRHRA